MKFLFFLATLFLGGFPSSLAAPSTIRVVNCDQQVQSHKRGICANKLESADFRALAPGVSWYYNWHYESSDSKPADVSMDYIPMVWGDRPADVAGLSSYLQTAAMKPRVIFAINEPNLKDQAFISPKETADLYRRVQAIATPYHLDVVGPHMALGSPLDGSIKALDPIEKKEMTYTFMVPFLQAFFFYLEKPQVPALSLHSYGSIGELKWAVETLHKTFNCPIWVTEYAQWNAPDSAAAREYLMQATDFLERTSYVQGYAWFKERADNDKISLLQKQPGKLSRLGETYVNMPTHDEDVYYRIPGKLPAANYRSISDLDLLTSIPDNLLLTSTSAEATADYNLQVESPGKYNLALRVLGAGEIKITEGSQTLASAPLRGNGVETINCPIHFQAGLQTIKVHFGAVGETMSSLNFTK